METMRTSSPGFRPASSMAWMAPMAMSSLCANSTSIFFFPSALMKASITSLPLARVKSPLCDSTIWKRASWPMTSRNPFWRSFAGAEPTVPCSSTTRIGPLRPSLSLISQRAARRPSSTKSDPMSVTYSDSSGTFTARSVSTTGIPAALASPSTVSQPVSTTGEKAITSTCCAMKERSALIWFSCFCCPSENLSRNSGSARASLTERVLAVRHSLSAPTWLNPTTIAPLPACFGPEQPASSAMHSSAINPGSLVILIPLWSRPSVCLQTPRVTAPARHPGQSLNLSCAGCCAAEHPSPAGRSRRHRLTAR